MLKKFLVSILAAAWTLYAVPSSQADTSIGVRIGTLGGGLELAHAFSETLGFRISANALHYSESDTHEDINYDAKLKLETAQLLFDWYPFSNNFRISAGAMYNGNKLSLDGVPSGGTFTINGNTYSSTTVDSVHGDVDFNKAAPYVGVGYGRPIGKGLSLIADLGVLFQGSPTSTLIAHCGPTATPTTCAQIQSDVAAEQAKLNDDMQDYKYYPVVSIGIAYVF